MKFKNSDNQLFVMKYSQMPFGFLPRKIVMMQKSLYASFLLLLFVFITSCQGQQKVEPPPKTPPTEIIHPTLKLPEVDSYFTESNGESTPYGPKSITRTILQARNGDIWLATWEGIFHYNGKMFTNYTNKEGLRRYRVFTILEDQKGGLWFGTIGAGVYHYDGKVFTNITTEEGLINDKVVCIYEDKKERIWFGTVGGISVYDGKTFRNFTTKEGLCDNEVNAIIEDRNGKFWFGSRGNACTYDGETFTQLTRNVSQPFVNVRSIIEDQNGYIWLGGNDGLWRYKTDGTLTNFTNFSKRFTGRIYEDSKGNIWVSHESENPGTWVLSRYDKKPLPYENPTATEIRKEDNMFFGITEDTNGHIWFGSLKGVCRYDGESFNYFREPDKAK